MIRNVARAAISAGLLTLAGAAMAGWDICIDPNNSQPYSTDYGINSQFNDLMRCTIGGSGTVTYGSATGPCFGQAINANVIGRIGFASGPVGTVQSNFDDDMAYTFGMPFSPGGTWSYATIIKSTPGETGTTSTLWNGVSTFFVGVSHRYIEASGSVDTTGVVCHADVLGDCTRITWSLTNQDTEIHSLGLWYGAWIALLPSFASGAGQSAGFGSPPYVLLPGRKPLVAQTRLTRQSDPANFPDVVKFVYSQENAYGMQADLGPTPSTSDNTGQNSDATLVDEIAIGDATFLLGVPSGGDVNTMPDTVLPDAGFGSTGFITKYQPTGSLAQGQTRKIIQYVRDTWGNSRYALVPGQGGTSTNRPFSTVVDAPRILLSADDGGGTNGLSNNPFTIRVYIDNVGGYTGNGTEFPLNSVHIKLNLPEGMTFSGGDQAEKIINNVPARTMTSVDWTVEADGIEVGDLPYSVSVTSIPGPSTTDPMIINGTIRVAATEKIRLEPGANLISVPWNFADTSWESILGLSTPQDFTAYNWSPSQNSYVISTSAARGVGTWIVVNPATHPNEFIDNYAGATPPTDTTTGAPPTQLKSGWNLIGNPYQYAFPMGQFVGVSAANPGQSFTFAQLVSQGIVSPYLAYYDPEIGSYRYIQGTDAPVQPNRGYWIKVLTSQDLTLSFPALYDLFIPNGGGSRPAGSLEDWSQSPTHWRVNIQAQQGSTVDAENYVGVVTNKTNGLQVAEPPMTPNMPMTLTVHDTANSAPMAQIIRGQNVQQDFFVKVYSKQGGAVKLSWPNMATVPSNVSLFLVNTETGQQLNMRSINQTGIQMHANETKVFKIKASATSDALPVIKSVSATNGTSRLPAIVKFALNSPAKVTLEIKNSAGRVVATLLKDQETQAGESAYPYRSLLSGLGKQTFTAVVTATAESNTTSMSTTFTVSR